MSMAVRYLESRVTSLIHGFEKQLYYNSSPYKLPDAVHCVECRGKVMGLIAKTAKHIPLMMQYLKSS